MLRVLRIGRLGMLLVPTVSLLEAGCANTLVKPDLTTDSRPRITVLSSALVGGAVSPDTVQNDASSSSSQNVVYSPTNTKLQLIFRADDAVAGVAKLVVRLAPGQGGSDDVAQTATLDAKGLAPTSLILLGHAQFYGLGAQVGPGTQPFDLTVSRNQTVHVSATNFAGKTTKFDVNYVPLEPVRARIEISPSTIEAGGKALLYEDWNGATDVTITPATPLISGGTYVSPQSDTTYTMTARQPFSETMVGYPNANGVGEILHPTIAISTATLKVKPSASTSGSIVTTAVFLLPSPPLLGWLPYTLTWPPQGTGYSGATLVKLGNPNPFLVRLVKTGYTSVNCGDSVGTVQLAQGQATTAQDNSSLFYQQQLPINIIACILNGASVPPNLRLDITYKNL